jgi:translocation and assembly module TamB
MLRLLRHLLLGLVLILSGLSGVLFWLLDTESGLQWILKQIPDLKIKSIQGRLLEDIALKDISFHNKEINLQIQQVRFSWQPLFLIDKKLVLNSLIIEKANIELPAPIPTEKPAKKEPLEIPDLKLPIQIILQDIQLLDLQIKQGDQTLPALNELLLSAEITDQLQIHKLDIKTPLATADLKGFFQLSKPFDLNFKINWQAPIPMDNLQASGNALLHGNLEKLILEHDLKNPIKLNTYAQVETPLTNPLWQTHLKWETIQYPLSGNALVQTSNGDIQAQGNLKEYQIKIATDLKGQQIPVSKWFIDVEGDFEKAKINQLRSELLKGIFETAGKVSWKPNITWELALKGEKFQPSVQFPELDGEIGFKIQTDGKLLENHQPQANVNIEEIAGKLRNYPINLKSQLFIDKTHYFLKNLTAQSDSATLQAKADFQAPNINAEFQLQANNLKEVLPKAQGKIQAKGQINGTLPMPKIALEMNANNAGFEDLILEKLKLVLNADPLKNQAFNIALDAQNLSKSGKLQLKSAKLRSDGTLPKHNLNLTVDSPIAQVNTQLKGGFFQTQQMWKGQLEKLFFEMPDLAKINLLQASNLNLSAKSANLEKSCFNLHFKQQKAGKNCVSADWNLQKGASIENQLSEVSLTLLKPYLPSNISIDNVLNGTLQAKISPNNTISAKSDWELKNGQLKIEHEINGLQTFEVLGGTLNLNLDQQGLQTKLNFQPLDFVKLEADIKLPNFGKLPINLEKQTIQGKIYTKVENFDRFPQLVSVLEKAEGFLQLSADLSGKLTSPQIQGVLEVNAPLLQLPDLGLKFKDLQLTARNQNLEKLDIQGTVNSGNGYLGIGGTLAMKDKMQLVLDIEGKNFEVLNNPNAWVIISPKISVQFQPNLLNLNGEIVIPDANITPVLSGGTGGGVGISPDAKVKSKQKTEETAKSALQILGEIKIKLDEKIRLKVADFQSRLGGEFVMNFKPNELIPLANGSINVFDGFYRAYGQDLQIKKGQIAFTGDYVSNPTLDIETIRKIYGDPAVEMAGVSIKGLAKKPEIKLFSKPQLPESKVLSYVMFGNSMLEQGGNRTMQMGIYLTPELYVGYGLNVLQSKSDNSQNFNIRYELTPRWGIEAQFSQSDSGVDISYTIE